MHNNKCKPDYHIHIVYCGGCCISHYRDYNQTLKLFESEYSENHMIVSDSDWTDYHDVIKYQEYTSYCMLSNGCFITCQSQSILIKNMAMSA